MLSPPYPLDEIQPNLVRELLPWMGVQQQKNAQPHGALWRGQELKYTSLLKKPDIYCVSIFW